MVPFTFLPFLHALGSAVQGVVYCIAVGIGGLCSINVQSVWCGLGGCLAYKYRGAVGYDFYGETLAIAAALTVFLEQGYGVAPRLGLPAYQAAYIDCHSGWPLGQAPAQGIAVAIGTNGLVAARNAESGRG